MTKCSRRPTPFALAGSAATCLVMLGLSGCAIGNLQLTGASPSFPAAGAVLNGTVHGGQSPIYNSQLQLYAAGAPAAPTGNNPIVGGLGQGATALIPLGSMTVGSSNNYFPGGAHGCTYTTGNTNGCTVLPSSTIGGNFTITSDWTCPTGNPNIYLVATGGDPTGANSPTISNQYIALMAALGPCSGISSSTTILMNEITTVGAVYALNQFMAPPSGAAASTYSSQGGATSGIAVNIGASSGPVGGYGSSAVQTQQVGMSNAFRMVNNLTDYTLGTPNPVAANTWATPYSAMTLTIANIIATCVNTNPAVSASACTNLMNYTKVGSYTPADTIQAAWSMARYPQTSNAGNLYNMIAANGAAFGGSLSSAPGQFTIQVGFTPTVPGGNSFVSAGCASGSCAISNAPTGAFDEYGHLWTLNLSPQSTAATSTAPQTKGFVTEIDANGAFLNGPYNSYTAHGGYQPSGADPCATGYTHYFSYGTSGNPWGMAIDQNNVVWVSNSEEYTNNGGISSGDCTSAAAYTIARIIGSNSSGAGASVTTGYYSDYPVSALAVDANNNVWASPAAYSSGNPIVTLTNSGTFATGAFDIFQGQGGAVAFDTAGNTWVSSSGECASTNGGVLFQSPTSSVAGPALTAGYYGANVTCAAGTANSPTQAVNSNAELGEPYGIAVDANNGVWVANYKNEAVGTSYNAVTYLLPQSSSWINSGTQATPDTTPIPAAAANNVQTSQGNTYNYGMGAPGYVAVDGSNNAWIASLQGSRLSELSVTLSGSGSAATIGSIQSVVANASGLVTPTTGGIPFTPSAGANWLGIDPSGNVWVLSSKAQSNGSTNQTNYVTVYVGTATPVITPLVYQVQYNRIGQTPQ